MNGISFGTNAILTTNWGGSVYSSDVDTRYSGSDPALQNLYYTYREVNSWTLGSSASFRFSNLTPGRVYEAQFNSGAQWDWAALHLYATADSGSNTLFQYLGNVTPTNVVYRSLYTWEATTNAITGETNFAEVNMYPQAATRLSAGSLDIPCAIFRTVHLPFTRTSPLLPAPTSTLAAR